MNKKIIIGIIIVLLALILFLMNQKSYYNGKLPPKVEGSVYYTDTRAQELFKSEDFYSLKSLKGHEVYLTNETINIDFYFDDEADNHQIDNARSFALVTFALRHASNYGESPYGFLLLGEQSIEWKKTACRIYVNDKLNIEETYDENGKIMNSKYK